VSRVKVSPVAVLRGYQWLLPALLLGVLLPVAIAGLSGNLTIPHNDAWSYSRIARTFGLTGEIHLSSWNRSALLGQIVVLGPLARSLLVQQLFVAALGALLLLSVFELLRRRVGNRAAGLVAVGVACWPGFALLTTSYMADIPAAATAVASVWVGELALRRDRRWLFVLALLLGLWSCTIRLQSIAAPVALIAWALLRPRAAADGSSVRVNRAVAVVGAVVFGVFFAAFTVWQSSLPNGDPASFAVPADWFGVVTGDTVKGFYETALVAGPVALIAGKPWTWRWPSWAAAAAVAAAGVIAAVVFGRDFFLPNYLSQSGAYGVVFPPVRVQFSDHFWWLIIGFAIAMGAVLAGAIAASRPRLGSVLALFTILTLLGTAATAVLGQSVFGRYLIPLLPGLFALVLRPRTRDARRTSERSAPIRDGMGRLRVPVVLVGAATLAATGLLSGALAANAWANDRARWNVGVQAAAAGVPSDRIDAGFEWMGWFSPNGVIQAHPTSGFGHEGMFSTSAYCVVTVPSPMPSNVWTLREEVPYRNYLVAGLAHLYVYDTHAPGC